MNFDLFITTLQQSDQPLSSSQLKEHLGTSQPTISRLLKRAGERVVRIGKGRATRYAASRDAFGTGPRVPLFSVDEAGRIAQVGALWALAGGQYFFAASTPTTPFWLFGLSGSGLFDSLPYYLYDQRPVGFLGRLLARSLASEWGTPADPRRWTDHHTGQFLMRRGKELPGNLILGEGAAQRANNLEVTGVQDRSTEYPQLAQLTLGDGVPPGSSAAGEQPKFAIYHEVAGHVIVKYSPAATTPDARRWRDLLRAEERALTHLRHHGIETAATSLYAFEGRLFLESRRFDRRGARGRVPSISLAMVDAEFTGQGHGWVEVGQALHQQGLLDSNALRQLAWIECFGAWIGNSDMHLGNISLRPGREGFTLHPLYDMLPMAFAPVRGELPQMRLRPPLRTAENDEVWVVAGQCAGEYWQSLTHDEQLTDEFKRLSDNQARQCRRMAI